MLNKTDPMVSQPPHYTQGELEAIEVMEAKLTPREFIGAMKFQILKYTMRASYKGKEAQDLAKAEWYNNRLNKYIANLDKSSSEY